MALLAVAGVVCVHFAMNLADDYFDYRADMMGARDRVIRKGFRAMTEKYPYLTDGSETPASLMRAIVCMLCVALVCGAGVFVFRLYGNGFGGPHGLLVDSRGRGSRRLPRHLLFRPALQVRLPRPRRAGDRHHLRPLLMTGCFYAAAGCVSSEVLWLSAAVGLLVMNILYTHSFIDMAGDEESGKMTLARLLRTDAQRIAAAWTVNLLPYLLVVGAAVFGYLSPFYLLVLFVLPRSLWLCGSLRDFAHGQTGLPTCRR